MQRDSSYDAIIVGGGLAGLAAATFVARSGQRVLLLERSHALGGRAQTTFRDGFSLNLGPHALYRGGAGIEVLRELGINPAGGVPSTSGAFAIRDGVRKTFPAGAFSLLTTSLLDLPSKFEAARFMGSIRGIEWRRLMSTTVNEWVDSELRHAGVRALARSIFRLATYVNAPASMSAGVAIRQTQLAVARNVLYLDGGWQRLVDALRGAAEQAGASIKTGAVVQQVQRDAAGAARAVHLSNGDRYDARVVIIAAGPADAVELIENGRESSLARFAAEARPVKAATLDIGLRRLPDPKAAFALGIDQPFYFSVHSASARLAPDGEAMIHVAKYLPPGVDEEPASVQAQLESVMELIQPGWREQVAYSRFLPGLDVANMLPTAGMGGTDGRPGPAIDDLPGLFVVGDWVGRDGWLADGALASARECAGLVAHRTEASAA
jgi:phytoene dehydrogenase-like protein